MSRKRRQASPAAHGEARNRRRPVLSFPDHDGATGLVGDPESSGQIPGDEMILAVFADVAEGPSGWTLKPNPLPLTRWAEKYRDRGCAIFMPFHDAIARGDAISLRELQEVAELGRRHSIPYEGVREAAKGLRVWGESPLRAAYAAWSRGGYDESIRKAYALALPAPDPKTEHCSDFALYVMRMMGKGKL
jgi:hypothetical protein